MDPSTFGVSPYVVKDEGGKRALIIDARGAFYTPSIADDRNARFTVLKILTETEADLVVLADIYERVYNEEQAKMLSEIASMYTKFEVDSIWSYSHLGDPSKENEKDFGERHNVIVKVAHEEILFDPVNAYLLLLSEVKRENARLESLPSERKATVYAKTLIDVKTAFEATELIRRARALITKLDKMPDTNQLYRSFFEANVKPSFIGSRLLVFGDEERLELLDEYSVKEASVQIFKHPSKVEKLYFISLPEYSLTPEKYFLVSKTKETVATYQPGRASLSNLAKSRRYFERVYQSTMKEIAKAEKINVTNEEIIELSQIVARYTVGYGVLEILLSDRKVTDVYIDAPIGNKLTYLVHSEFGQCQTNVIYTQDEADSFVSKLRAMSGRPFDEAHPVLDYDLPELDTRVAAISPPLSPDGSAFAFRLHKTTPWTLAQFVDVKYLPPLAAGLFSFFIDSQATMLVTGSRGSGKTSLMSALMLEIMQSSRVICQEDTLELPIEYMKKIGFNIQRLKTRSPIGSSDNNSEVAPEEALRTALRLGDSALVVGEVRSKEAKVLYEAMRVGAAGNIVMGTIHGDSAYSVWDRIVNDLEVPTTSFKATDIVAVARPIRFKGSLQRHRRVVQVTEVKKHWNNDPSDEGGLLDLMTYDASRDSLDLIEDNLKESDLFSKISKTSGLSLDQIWKSIRAGAESKSYLVSLKNEFKIPHLLEAEYTVQANNKLVLLKEEQLEQFGSVDYDEMIGQWKNWARNVLVKKVKERS